MYPVVQNTKLGRLKTTIIYYFKASMGQNSEAAQRGGSASGFLMKPEAAGKRGARLLTCHLRSDCDQKMLEKVADSCGCWQGAQFFASWTSSQGCLEQDSRCLPEGLFPERKDLPQHLSALSQKLLTPCPFHLILFILSGSRRIAHT